MLCAGNNCLSPANIRLCARGNITTDDLHSDASAISLLAISFSLLVLCPPTLPREAALVEKKGFRLELPEALAPFMLRTQTKGSISTGS
jgi:hypothetical protein